MRLRLSCKESSRLLSQAQDAKLGLPERMVLRLHLGACEACTRFSRQLEFMRRAVQAWPGPEGAEENR